MLVTVTETSKLSLMSTGAGPLVPEMVTPVAEIGVRSGSGAAATAISTGWSTIPLGPPTSRLPA